MLNIDRSFEIIKENYSIICNLFDFLTFGSDVRTSPLVTYQQIQHYFTQTVDLSAIKSELIQTEMPAPLDNSPAKRSEASPSMNQEKSPSPQKEKSPSKMNEPSPSKLKEQ